MLKYKHLELEIRRQCRVSSNLLPIHRNRSHNIYLYYNSLIICIFLTDFFFQFSCSITGYEWVGWRNDSIGLNGKPVEMVFEFDSIRNFSSIILHTNNMFSKDVQVCVFLYLIPLTVIVIR